MKHTTKLLSIIAVTCMLLGLMGCQPTTGNIGCSHNFEKTSSVEPTCTEKGYDIYTCSLCNETEKCNFVNALGHNFGETPSSVKEATCTTKGYDVYTCSRCNETKNCNFVNALGHKWVADNEGSEWHCKTETCDETLACGENDFLVYVFESKTSNISDFIDIIVIKGKKDCVTYNTLKNDISNKDIKFISTSFMNGERLWVSYTEVETECENETISSPVWIILG